MNREGVKGTVFGRKGKMNVNEREPAAACSRIKGKENKVEMQCTLVESNTVNEAEDEVAEAMYPADDNNMHPGKLHSRYFVKRLNVAREIRSELEVRW